MTSRMELEGLPRERLIEHARRVGVPRPEVMTRVELVDEVIRRKETDAVARRRARGWLGVARDLVASLIEQGLNMPDAADLVRAASLAPTRVVHQPPVATVTLAEIYATQGHVKRALGMLDEVLAKEPDHRMARALRDRLAAPATREVTPRSAELDPEPESEREPESVPEAVSSPAAMPLAAPESRGTAAEPRLNEPEPRVNEPEAKPVPAALSEPATAALSEPVPAALSEPVPAAPSEPVRVALTDPVRVALSEPATAAPHPEPLRPAVPEIGVVCDADAIVLLAEGDDALFLHWELCPKSRVRVRGEGQLVARIVSITPCIAGSRKRERELALGDAQGSIVVPRVERRAIHRAALGWRTADGFVPLAVGVALEPDGPSEPRVTWQPSPRALDGLRGATTRALAAFRARSATRAP